jgi:hypothetical protein
LMRPNLMSQESHYYTGPVPATIARTKTDGIWIKYVIHIVLAGASYPREVHCIVAWEQ